MKNIKIYALLFLAFLGACEADDEQFFLDVNNQEEAIGQLNGGSILTFNPSEDTSNFVTVGVSTISDQSRSFTIAIDEDNTTLDASFYTIPTLTGTIPAGSFTGDLEIITPIPSTLPASGLVLSIDLISIEGASILENGNSDEDIPLTVACPSVELGNVIGSATTLENPLLVAFGVPATFSDPRQIIAGPGDNQIIIVGGLSADIGGTDVILTIDPETGIATSAEDGGVGFVSGANIATTTDVSGNVLTCINQVTFTVNNAVFGAPFNSNTVVLEIQ